nr:C39 family peptidase [uncultured Desulfobulbus sp.]
MNAEFFTGIRQTYCRTILIEIISFFLVLSVVTVAAQAQSAENPENKKLGSVLSFENIASQPHTYFSSQTVTTSEGTQLEKYLINGPPVPPPGYDLERAAVLQPASNSAAGIVTLTTPAFNWVFGCSSVSGAMIAGYYDRNGYPDIYTGPTNAGVMPLDNSSWPTWSDGYNTYPNLPLAASHKGVDGRSVRGSIDDYWVQYDSSADDPYLTGGWSQHTWGDAIGDYMKTSQSPYNNLDGSTIFYNWTSSVDPLTCAQMASYGIDGLDGTYGRKLFYEARGYTVMDCYNQKTDNNSGGFTFANFKAEIDAGRPVMLNLEGHTVVGVGYDDSSSLVYIHDTWDYSTHTMTWGGSYSGMQLLSVSVVNLAPPSCVEPTVTTANIYGIGVTSAFSGGDVTYSGCTSSVTVTDRGVCWSTSSDPTTSDICTHDGSGTGSFTSKITGLTENTPYHVRAFATNSYGTGYGADLTFTTLGSCDGYNITFPTYNFEDISSTGTQLALSDDSYAYFSIPFTFSFYGNAYTAISVGSNGTVYFEDSYLGFGNTDIPAINSDGVLKYIALFWDDLNPSADGIVVWEVLGTAPSRRLVVQWTNVPHFGSASPTNGGTFQVVLYEGSNNIRLNYADVDFGDASFDYGISATVGIQRDSDCGVKFSYNSKVLKNDLSILFSAGKNIDWFVPIKCLLLEE